MANDTDRFRCPCCHENLEFDRSTGSVRKADAKTGASDPPRHDMDALIEKQAKDDERRGDAFSTATEDALQQADKFDALFDDALEQAKKDKDKKPRNPFDMD
jgi:hypothetical protein